LARVGAADCSVEAGVAAAGEIIVEGEKAAVDG
jgi:hypothetical protein